MKKIFLFLFFFFITSNFLFADKEWTILVYMDADNNLEANGLKDFNEMEKVGSSDNVNIIVQMDRASGYSTLDGDWTDTKRFFVEKDDDIEKITSPVIENLGEKNMGDEKTLENFIIWGMENYPAKRYFLIIWNHGGGWRVYNKRNANRPKAIAWDDTDNDVLNFSEVRDAINNAVSLKKHKIDIVGYDACLVGMVEIADMSKGTSEYPTDIMVASEFTEPLDGWPYDIFVEKFVSSPFSDTETLASNIVDSYYDFYSESDTTTLSAIRLTELDSFFSALNTLNNISNEYNVIKKARDNAVYEKYNGNYETYKDLGSFLENCIELFHENENRDIVKSILEKYNDLVYYAKATGEAVNATGLTIYFPNSEADAEWSDYTEINSDIVKDSQWKQFLSSYFTSDKTTTDAPIFTNVSFSQDGYSLNWNEIAGATSYELKELSFSKEMLFFDGFESEKLSGWEMKGFKLSSKSFEGAFSLYSGDGDNYDAVLKREVDLTAFSGSSDEVFLDFYFNLGIEPNYDHFYVKIDGHIVYDYTLNIENTEGFRNVEISLSQYKGKVITVEFEYKTDESEHRGGVFIDNISINKASVSFYNTADNSFSFLSKDKNRTYVYFVSSYNGTNYSDYSIPKTIGFAIYPKIKMLAPGYFNLTCETDGKYDARDFQISINNISESFSFSTLRDITGLSSKIDFFTVESSFSSFKFESNKRYFVTIKNSNIIETVPLEWGYLNSQLFFEGYEISPFKGNFYAISINKIKMLPKNVLSSFEPIQLSINGYLKMKNPYRENGILFIYNEKKGWEIYDYGKESFIIRKSAIYYLAKDNIGTLIKTVTEAKLYNPFPNPSAGECYINFEIINNSNITLAVYNVKGQLIKQFLKNVDKPKGRYEILWNGKDRRGNLVSSGLYYVMLKTGGKKLIKKIVIIK